MHDDAIRRHIEALDARTDAQAESLRARIEGACWPGGGDRLDRAALEWLRGWRPERLGARLPACSCAAGHCVVCN